MLDDERTTTWLIVLAVAAVALLYRAAGKRSDRKRRAWFESVATAFAARAQHDSEFISSFEADVDQRRCRVEYRHSSHIGWTLVTTVALRGVSDIYNFVLQPTNDGVDVRNSGFSPRDGWLNPAVRTAISRFYEVTPRKVPLSVEAGTVMCRTSDRLEGTVVRARLARLVPVAKALEQAL